jgi:superfamily II DNA or RNA helicase
MGAMVGEQTSTLILFTNTVAVHQWRDELLDKTDLKPDHLGECTGERKDVRAVTIATYQLLIHRERGGGDFPPPGARPAGRVRPGDLRPRSQESWFLRLSTVRGTGVFSLLTVD